MQTEKDFPQVGPIYRFVRDFTMGDIRKENKRSTQQTHLWDDKEDREGFVIR
jgi:hypothetical protein